MEKLTDTDILARLIYRAYIAPDPNAPLEAEALLPFQAALDLYAKTIIRENREAAEDAAADVSDSDTAPLPGCTADSCPVMFPEPPEDPGGIAEAPPLRKHDPDGFQPVTVPLKAATHTHTHTHTHSRGH